MNSGGSVAHLPLCDQQLFCSCWQCGCGCWASQGWALLWEKRFFQSCIVFLSEVSVSSSFLLQAHSCCRYSDRFQWEGARGLRPEIYFAPLVKLLPSLLVYLLNGFPPLPPGASMAESKLWDCCIMHIDYLFTFPTRLRKLINFRWTKADSEPAEICNKSLKWKYNSIYNSGKMPFDICR